MAQHASTAIPVMEAFYDFVLGFLWQTDGLQTHCHRNHSSIENLAVFKCEYIPFCSVIKCSGISFEGVLPKGEAG